MTYGTSLDQAERLCRRARVRFLGAEQKPPGVGPDKAIVDFEVRTFNADPLNHRAGVWPRWRYTDRPDLPVFGGPFVPLKAI